MNDIIHEILSQVHHLLSIATEEELRRAGELPSTSRHLRVALQSLAAEKSATRNGAGSGTANSRAARESAGGHERSPKPHLDGLERELRRSFEKLGKNEIQEACKSVGLSLPVKAKDARDRIIRRVAKIVAAMPEGDRDQVLSAMRIRADTQTEGWVGVIRKGQ